MRFSITHIARLSFFLSAIFVKFGNSLISDGLLLAVTCGQKSYLNCKLKL